MDFFEDQDPTADFLAREQELLGDDNIFASTTPVPPPVTETVNTAITTPEVQNPIVPSEPEAILKWRESFKSQIQERDAISKSKKANLTKNAQESLKKFYAEYNDKKQKNLSKNTPAPKEETGNDWEKCVKLIDQLSNNSKESKEKKDAKKSTKKDTSRMKQVLVSLKNDKKAPGLLTA